jgi:glucokinase
MSVAKGTPVILAALDIGGTKIGCAVGTSEGKVLAQRRFPTDPAAPPGETIDRALAVLAELIREADCGSPVCLGVACPGPFLQPEGRFLDVPNLLAWQGFDLVGHLNTAYGETLAAMNDANAGVLAEHLWGAAQGADTAVFLTMSTGMGAGFWLGGRLFEGPAGFAGEVGHLRLSAEGPVGFGKPGSVEGYLSGPGMVQVAEAELLRQSGQGASSCLEGTTITPEVLCQAASDGDPIARASVDCCARKLGELCALLVDLLNPDVIVLGTIGSAFPDLFIPPAMEIVRAEALAMSFSRVDLVPSELQDRGILSALAVARQAFEDHD